MATLKITQEPETQTSFNTPSWLVYWVLLLFSGIVFELVSILNEKFDQNITMVL